MSKISTKISSKINMGNFFENITTIQFDHRLLAIATLISSAFFWVRGIRKNFSGRLAVASHLVFSCVCLQVLIGIITLIFLIPVTLAALHQANAFILFGAIVWLLFEIRRD